MRHAESNTEKILASLVDPMNEDDSTSLSERVSTLESKVRWKINLSQVSHSHTSSFIIVNQRSSDSHIGRDGFFRFFSGKFLNLFRLKFLFLQ